MPKHLVIVESPAKAKTINKFLGRNYSVKASMGHIRDLPKSKIGVDVEKDFQPQYVNSRDKSKVIKELKDAAKKADSVILAPDPDREGEAIAWHLQELLAKEVKSPEAFTRVTYNQITKSAIQEAFAQPRSIDMQKVDAQQARRVIDRLVGYQISPLLWRRIRGGSSAGRVQTVALRLVCEREKEILAFIPETYWIFGARCAKQNPEASAAFDVRLLNIDGGKGELRDADEATALFASLEGKGLKVEKIQRKRVKRRAQPPFITSTLQQAASSACGFQPNRTMSLAQKLYEGVDLGTGEGATGLITYMRTDSPHLAGEALSDIRGRIEQQFGSEYLPEKPNFYRTRGNAQEAHEAIRPTDLSRTPDSLRSILGKDEWRLYELIWKRTLACQMLPAEIDQLSVDLRSNPLVERDLLFRANASEVAFPGYMAAWGRGLDEGDDDKDSQLPPLEEGEALNVLEWLKEEKQTQPPKRFSEAALIKALEENGVGRPSTYASIVSTLYSREYVEREARSLRPTKAGMEVHDFLVERLPSLFEVGFTAHMEEELDEIEDGKRNWTDMMAEFHGNLEGWIHDAKTHHLNRPEIEELLKLCGEISTFNPPSTRGKKTYDDSVFVQEMNEALVEEFESITDRQVENLRNIVARYAKQISSLSEDIIARLKLKERIEKEAESQQPPRPETLEKFEVLVDVEFEAPRKVGKKTYDDREFADSLREQVEGGKRLSDNQVRYLNRLVSKYAAQIADYDQKAEAWGMDKEEEDTESPPLLEMLEHVTEFNEPTTKGKKTWDDAEFADSLKSQFKSRKNLSPRQRYALKSMLARYHDQIPDYMEKREALGLRAPKKAKAEKKD